MSRNIKITTEDACWISSRMKAHYRAVMKSRRLSQFQKIVTVHKLAERAHRLGFEELCNWMGYTYLKIDLGNDREAGIFYPTENRKEALEGALRYLKTLTTSPSDTPQEAGPR